MKPRSKRNRKRPRGGIGCLVGDGESDNKNDGSESPLPRVEVVPLSTAFQMISDVAGSSGKEQQTIEDAKMKHINTHHQRQMHDRRRVRIIHPYPYTFATFAKERWLGRSVVDVYHEEFGSYPRSYYEAAIKAGRILVSGRKVDCNYKIVGGDELTHTVHRHEPAVALADVLGDGSGSQSSPPIQIIHEDDSLLVVDKPATLPIHPCGGYQLNTLFQILLHWKPDLYGEGKLFTVHRLDRLTSGIVLIAKSSALARSLSTCISERDECEKIYLARVKGKFPLNLQNKSDGGERDVADSHHSWKFRYNESDLGQEECHRNKRQKCSIVPCQYGEVTESTAEAWRGGMRIPIINCDSKKKNQNNNIDAQGSEGQPQSFAGLGFWLTDGHDVIVEHASLQDLIHQCKNVPMEEMLARATGSKPVDGNSSNITTNKSMLWLNFACPCRVASHKNGVCEAGEFSDLLHNENDRKGIKPAQTSFALLSYDAASDTSLVVAKPVTGRTHQIRLHLQKLGHPIANDHCYGGELWFGDEEGKRVCKQSREWLNRLDRGTMATGDANGVAADSNSKAGIVPENSSNADTPASEAEIYHAAANRPREEGESILDFIEKTCVWCARCRGVDDLDVLNSSAESKLESASTLHFRRTLMEYLVRSQGIWLHALQYSMKTNDENGRDKTLQYRTNLPSWATL